MDCFKGKKPYRRGITCDKGDDLVYNKKARERKPYNGSKKIVCNICRKTVKDVKKGYYTCKHANEDCDYDCCKDCFEGTGEKEFTEGVTCSTGDDLKFRTKPRQRSPYKGGLAINCNICKLDVPDVRKRGYYACNKADKDCDYDVCVDCFKG